MIHESKYWKQPLLRAASWMHKLRVQDSEVGERDLVRVEREIFIGFYAIRKLLETFKVSLSTKELRLDVQAFKANTERKADYFNKTNIDELFDLDHPCQEQRDIGFLCNQIVHSFIFLIATRENGALEGFFVASDSMRFKKLYFVGIDQVIHAFKLVGKDYPSSMQLRRNESTDQWEAHE